MVSIAILALMAISCLQGIEANPCPPLGPTLPSSKTPSDSTAVKQAIAKIQEGLANRTSSLKATAISIGVKSIHESAEAARNKGKLNFVPWDSITIEDLASHVSGLGGDIATDLAVFPGNWAALGLPPVSNSTKPTCSGLGGTKPCTADVYSNIGLSLLSLVLETATNKTYESILTETILKPLGLANTSIAVPADDAWGFIPKGEVTWGGDLGVFASAGGIYTNTRDLLAFGAAILSSDLGIDTRSWLKPRAFTSSRGYSIGAPWEIWTSSTLLDSGVPVSAYTKSGDLGLYTNVLIVVPDYDLVISILTAGAEAAESSQFPARVISPVIETLIPALEQANKEYADATFAGTYIDDETNSTLTLSVDDGPGLSLTNYTVRGVNVLANIPNYGLSPGPKTFNVSGRLYPTNIREGDQWSWRAVYKNHDEPEIDDELFYPDGGCQTWGLIDRKAYNYLALDDFVVTAAKDGSATSISPRPFGVTLTKIES
ncbi:betalactamase [Colletotrichum higginsianum]|nr:betalactamase [Colletotrichum higginsianum]